MWTSAKAWGYVMHDPFDGLVLPKPRQAEVRCFSEEDVLRIVTAAPEPYRTFYRLAAETGLRAGELCGLRREDIYEGFVRVSGSVWHGRTQSTKTGAAIRTVAISSTLLTQLRNLQQETSGNTDVCYVFHSSKGTPWDANLLVKRKLRPLLASLNIELAGLHAFRHFNATALDRFSTPLKTRESRLGHTDARFTLRQYTHAVASDDQRVATEFGKLFDAIGQDSLLKFAQKNNGLPMESRQAVSY